MEPQSNSDGSSPAETGPGLYLNIQGDVRSKLIKMMTWCAEEARAAGFLKASVSAVPPQLKLATLVAGELELEKFMYLPVTIAERQYLKFKDAVVNIDYSTPKRKERKNRLTLQPALGPELMHAINKFVLPENKYLLKLESEVAFLKLKAIPNQQLQDAYLTKLNVHSEFKLDIRLSDLVVKDQSGNTGNLCRLGQIVTLNSTASHSAVEYHLMKLNELYGVVNSNPDPEYPTEQMVRAQQLIGWARNAVAVEASISSESLRARHAAGTGNQPVLQLDGSYLQPGGPTTPRTDRAERLTFETPNTAASVATGGNREPLAGGSAPPVTSTPGKFGRRSEGSNARASYINLPFRT